MPVYQLEILEPEGGVTRGEHISPGGVRYDVDRFDYDGRTVLVKMLEKTDDTAPAPRRRRRSAD
jgi:hypothetical protein